jgi:hypothetical protein
VKELSQLSWRRVLGVGGGLSDEEADSAGPVKWVVPAWEVLANDRVGWRGGLEGLRVSEYE